MIATIAILGLAVVLAIWLVPGRGFEPLLAMLAVLMLLAGVLILLVRSDAPLQEGPAGPTPA